MLPLEVVIVIGLVIVAVRVLPMVIKGRQERRKRRDELEAKQKSAQTIENTIALLLADPDLAVSFQRRLERALAAKETKKEE